MLVLAGKKLKNLPNIAPQKPEEINTLDVSFNTLKSGTEFKNFKNLVVLNVDSNGFTSLADFPYLEKLETFSANKNQFGKLEEFLDQASQLFPKLKNLSLVGNPCCPFFEGESAYYQYKVTIIENLPYIENLDGVYVKKAGMKVKLAPNSNQFEEKKTEKVEDNVFAFKKTDAGYKMQDEVLDKEESDEDDEETRTENGKKLVSVIEFNTKYTKKPMRSMKLRSEGNRFVKNEML